MDSKSECFIFSIRYIPIPGPVNSSVRDFIISDDINKWEQVKNFITYEEISQQTVVIPHKTPFDSKSEIDDATIVFSMEKVKNNDNATQDNLLDHRAGARLLIGRYCLLDPNESATPC